MSTPSKRTRVGATLLVLATLVGTGCPEATRSKAPAENCTEVGEQCRLSPGKLGVCTMAPDGELECVPQH